MPLLDHRSAQLPSGPSWEGLLGRWACAVSDALNRQLPQRYLAECLVHLGAQVASDVTVSRNLVVPARAPPAVSQTISLTFPEEIEVRVFDVRCDRRLLAVIELVSPSNKETAADRQAFVAKCAACLQRGVGVIVVDVVSDTGGNLHRELLGLLGQGDRFQMPLEANLYAVPYRPVQRGEQAQLDLWETTLAVGQPLPVLPLALRGAFIVPVDFEATYTETRQKFHL
jgi:hypothetical protein